MAKAKDHGPSVKDDKLYGDLRDKGMSKEKAARIANAQANDNMHPSRKGGKAPPYEDWTKDDLYERAREIGIDGRSDMTKAKLIEALRSH
ncbi:Rho termination factor [Ponticoccus gilvus]|nr:Rho termination factor [Enemella evansiae]